MRRLHLALCLVLLAALSGAPSLVSANGTTVASRTDVEERTDELILTILLVGLAGVAGVALVGTGLLLATKRERRVQEPPPTALAQAAAALERRSVRRSKLRLADDPIVDAMGLDHESGHLARRGVARLIERDDQAGTSQP
jgi:hypothetical protein